MASNNLIETLDQSRASRQAEWANSGTAAADEPLVVDLPNGPMPGQHFIAYQISVQGFFAARVPLVTTPPSVGVYLVQQNAPIESLADAQNATFGQNQQSRAGISLPYLLNIAGAGTRKAFSLYVQLFADLVIPGGWTLRFIANVQPATATPGPGASSEAWLRAIVTKEYNAAPFPRGRV